MNHVKKNVFTKGLAILLAVLTIVVSLPLNAVAVDTADYATVTSYSGGKIEGNGTEKVTVTITEITLEWIEKNAIRTQDGWWVGINVTAPEGFSADAKYKVRSNPNSQDGTVKSFTENKDTENSIQLWFCVTPELLDKFISEDRAPTMTYEFDWNADETYEQTVVFSLEPSDKIVLMKGEEQCYPVFTYDVTVEQNAGGSVTVNDKDDAVTTVDRDADVEIEVQADAGYWISAVTINGESMTIDTAATQFRKTIQKIRKDTKVEVAFVKVYTATVTHDKNGTGTGVSDPTDGGSITVESGKEITITATPDTGNRVVMVTINGDEDPVKGNNDDGYNKTLTADKDYEVVITFAPNYYDIKVDDTQHGKVEAVDGVEYDDDATVTLKPDAGYTVDKVTVNGDAVTDIVKDEDGIHFSILNIRKNQDIVVTFKKIAKADLADVKVDADDALRVNDEKTLYVMKDGSSIQFSTEKDGIRMYAGDDLLGGSKTTQSIDISESTTITKIELFYKAQDEFYAVWHAVEMDAVKIVVDKGDNVTATLKPTTDANKNGYYNANVTFEVAAEDTGDYSGLKLVEYWITYNGDKGQKVTLYQHDKDIRALFEDEDAIVVNAQSYNSDNITVSLRVVDRAGNEKTVEKSIKINSTKPTVALDIDGNQASNAQEGYYNGDRELTINIVDRDSTFSKANAAAGLKIKQNGKDVEVKTTDIVWTDASNLHIGKYTFAEDGHYEWSFSYTNLADMSNDGVSAPADKSIYDFYLDKTAPKDLKISYEPTFTDVVLEGITLGFYKAPVTVKIEAVDETAEIMQFTYSYTVDANASSINSGKSNAVVEGVDVLRDGKKAYATFEIPAQFRGKVSFEATDKAGNGAGLTDENKTVVVDTVAPGVTVTYNDATAKNGKYYSGDRTATIKINEANFFEKDIEDGLLVLTRIAVANDGTRTEETLTPTFAKDGDVYTATVPFDQDADYTFDVKYTDRAGNVYDSYEADIFVVDKIKPVISVTFDNNNCINNNQFKEIRKATIRVVEHNFDANGMSVLVNSSAYAVQWKPVDNAVDTYEAVVPFPGDAHYTFAVSGQDLAGNANDGVNADGVVAPWAFTVDTTGPTDLKISYEPTFMGVLLENLTYGFYQAPVKVTIEAKDDISGIDSFTYTYAVKDGASTINEGKKDVPVDVTGLEANTSFEIPAQFCGFVSFVVTNQAGVSSSIAEDKNVVVVDTIAPGVTVTYNNLSAQNDSYYKADRTATIKITEANFFAKDIEDGLLVLTRTTRLNNGSFSEETLTPTFTKDGDVYTAEIPFDQDADYTFDVKYTDRAGNVYDSYTMDAFTVDKIQPKISIEQANGAYFNADRTAIITVEEHNFNPATFEFTAQAIDAAENPIDLSSKAYAQYLKNPDNWTEVSMNTWQAPVTFDIEGNYTIGATYTDLAGNEQVVPISDTFTIDKSEPTNLKVSYTTTFVDTLLETVTFGFYQAPVQVKIEADDTIAGVDHFVYSYLVDADASPINVGKSNVTAAATRVTKSYNAYATFDIPAQFRGKVSFTAYDRATNSESFADERVVVVDNVAPGVNVTYNNHNTFYDNCFKADRTATIAITEANFFGTDEWSQADLTDGLLQITVGKTLNDGTYTSTKMKPQFTKAGDVYTAEILFDEDADYTFDIAYTDRSGNVYDSYEMDTFTIDKTNPTIQVGYDAAEEYENGNQFRTDREATITITEHNFNAANVVAKVTASGTEVASYATYLKDAKNWTSNGDVHTAKIQYTEEAHYVFEIGYTDMAGNANDEVDYGDSVAPTVFTVDKSAPTDLDIQIAGESVKGSMKTIAFNKFYDAAVTVKLSANCDISGLQSLQYQKVADVSEYDAAGEWSDYNAKTGIVVKPSEKFVLYFRAEDKAGNVSIVRSTGIVVDNQKPIGETNAPDIDILPEEPNKNGIHNGDVVVDLKVVDPKYTGSVAADNGHYSGLNEITYRIYTTDTDATEVGTLLDLAKKTTGAAFDDDKLVKSWAGQITVDATKFNSNNVIVEVTAKDNAGNVRTTTTVAGEIQIDITRPTIDVSYDNNDGDTTFADATYFKENRTATVVITERNFNADNVVFTIANEHETMPTIGKWKTVKASGNGDETTHTVTIVYSADGDYTFDVAYTDEAENKNRKVKYGDSLAPTEFTVDKTLPTIEITYDNNDATNGNYYDDQRTATVVITEHNFSVSRVDIALKATDNGEDSDLPVLSSWNSDGDKHTVTITYAKDGLYTFDIDYQDNAGNASVDEEEHIFYVDQTAPVVSIAGIVDQSANNDEGDIGFTIQATDTNFDVFVPELTLTDVTGKPQKIEITSSKEITNGRIYTMKNIEKDGIYRITCTAVDKAGNAYKEVRLVNANGTAYTEQRSGADTLAMFSVNRNGSAYEINKTTAELIEKFYVQNVEKDVVLVEINADTLAEYTVTLNGKPLTEKTDYTVSQSGGEGSWRKYTYTIKKELFEDEGEYQVVVSSKDSAENDAFSDVKNAAVNFVVDRTMPIVTVTGMANNGRYQVEEQTVTLIPTDDGGALKSLKVYTENADGVKLKDLIDLSGDALVKALEENDGKLTFVLKEDLYQNVRIECTDCAVDEDGETNTYNYLYTNVSVSSSAFMIFWANKALRWGSIGGVLLLTAVIIFLIVSKKRKKQEDR